MRALCHLCGTRTPAGGYRTLLPNPQGSASRLIERARLSTSGGGRDEVPSRRRALWPRAYSMSAIVTSTSTPGSMLMEVICFTISDGECRSMRRLWMRISKRSHVLVPSPHGDLRVVMRSVLVGRRTGPLTFRRLSLAPLIRSAQTAGVGREGAARDARQPGGTHVLLSYRGTGAATAAAKTVTGTSQPLWRQPTTPCDSSAAAQLPLCSRAAPACAIGYSAARRRALAEGAQIGWQRTLLEVLDVAARERNADAVHLDVSVLLELLRLHRSHVRRHRVRGSHDCGER